MFSLISLMYSTLFVCLSLSLSPSPSLSLSFSLHDIPSFLAYSTCMSSYLISSSPMIALFPSLFSTFFIFFSPSRRPLLFVPYLISSLLPSPSPLLLPFSLLSPTPFPPLPFPLLLVSLLFSLSFSSLLPFLPFPFPSLCPFFTYQTTQRQCTEVNPSGNCLSTSSFGYSP